MKKLNAFLGISLVLAALGFFFYEGAEVVTGQHSIASAVAGVSIGLVVVATNFSRRKVLGSPARSRQLSAPIHEPKPQPTQVKTVIAAASLQEVVVVKPVEDTNSALGRTAEVPVVQKKTQAVAIQSNRKVVLWPSRRKGTCRVKGFLAKCRFGHLVKEDRSGRIHVELLDRAGNPFTVRRSKERVRIVPKPGAFSVAA